jgi:hypothetical protein
MAADFTSAGKSFPRMAREYSNGIVIHADMMSVNIARNLTTTNTLKPPPPTRMMISQPAMRETAVISRGARRKR